MTGQRHPVEITEVESCEQYADEVEVDLESGDGVTGRRSSARGALTGILLGAGLWTGIIVASVAIFRH